MRLVSAAAENDQVRRICRVGLQSCRANGIIACNLHALPNGPQSLQAGVNWRVALSLSYLSIDSIRGTSRSHHQIVLHEPPKTQVCR
jgi:hypothetical protein